MTMAAGPADDMSAVDYDPFAGAVLARVVPCTEAQREIWLAAQLEPAASLAYNEAVSFDLRGALDGAALRVALDALLARHEALRASFSADGAEMHVNAAASLELARTDLSALDEAARARAVDAVLERAVGQVFDLEAGPLLRADLLQLADDHHLLILATHHLVCDGWSFGVIARELGVLYSAACKGVPGALREAGSYADFALAELRHRQSDEARADEAYWLARYAQVPPPLELPLDRVRPRRRGFASRREDLLLDAAQVAALKRAGARQGASLFAMLLAGFAMFVHRLSAQDDLVVGIPAAGQAADGHDALVGHAVNVLPLRIHIDAATTLGATITAVRRELLDAFEHPRYTIGSLLRRLSIERDPARLPLASLLFNLDPGLDDDRLGFDGIAARFAGVPRSHENFELFVNAVQVGGAVRLECQYSVDLFDGATVARWLGLYAMLLQSMAAATGDEAVARLPMLSAQALAEVRGLQPLPVPYASGRRVESLVFEVAANAPERIALRTGERRISYAELQARAWAIAAALRERGAGPGVLVGIMLERSPDMLAAVLGVLASGAAYVPLDPAFPRERLAFMACDAALGVLLTDRAHVGAIDFDPDRTLCLEDIAQAAAAGGELAADGDAVAYVIYTSGSTGQPKGVRVPHRAVVNFLASMRREPGMAADDRLLAVTTLSFDIAVLELLLPLTAGACVVLATREQAGDGGALMQLIESHAVTCMQATPATWRLLLGAGWCGRDGFVALCGGEALPRDLAEALLSRCAALWNMYGPTETTVWSTCARLAAPLAAIPIGRPIDNTAVWILDAALQPCAVGLVGEIAIGGAGVTLGYLDRAELTAERFVADPFTEQPGARLYRTGDRGRWRNDGSLEHLGRLDFQVKLRGFRIELGDVEANLSHHPAIAHAVAIVREDRPGDQRLVAYLVLHAGDSVDDAGLRAHLRTRLPEYMLPQHFVRLDALPLLPNGKLDRARLPSPIAGVAIAPAASHVAPSSALERRVAGVMEDVLSLPGIGVHDNFFALGGHSLLAAQLTTWLGREFDLPLSLGLLFEAPTVATLAATLDERIARRDGADAPRMVARADQQVAPLSLLQTRLWLFEQLNPGSVVYNTPSAHRLRGELDEEAFNGAFNALVARQAVLRTSIGREGAELVQRVHAHVAVGLFPAEDLSGMAEAEREAELLRRLDALTDQPIALDHAPLFRVRMYRLGEHHHVLYFMPHHIIWDGWSFDLFYAELAALYAALRQGQAATLPPLPVSYGDFSAWHARWLESSAYRHQFERQLARWRGHLQTHGAVAALPTDMARPAKERVGRGETEWLAIPAPLTDAARTLARGADATLFMTLLAVYYMLLWRAGGDTRMVVGTPVRVRASAEVEPLMGLFTSLLPVPLELVPGECFVDLLARVRTAVLESLASPDVQLEDLMREPGMRELAGGGRLYQAQFSYQDARDRVRNWGGLEQEQVLLFQRAANEDLAIWFLEHGQGMTGGVLYDADLFEAETARRLAAQYVTLLERAVADPHAPLWVLSAAADAPEVQGAAMPEAGGLCAPITAWAMRDPARVALRTPDTSLSCAELDRRADDVAARLHAEGVAPGALVAILVDDPAAALIDVLGVLKAGATFALIDGRTDDAGVMRCMTRLGAGRVIGASQRAIPDRIEPPARAAASVSALPAAAQPAWAVDSGAEGGADVHALGHRALGAALDAVAQRLAPLAGTRIAVLAEPSSPLAVFVALLGLRAGASVVAVEREWLADGGRLHAFLQAASIEVVFASSAVEPTLVHALEGLPLRDRVDVIAPGSRPHADAQATACDRHWLALGDACAAIPFSLLQPAPRLGEPASPAMPPLAPLTLRLRGAHGERVMPGHVGEIDTGVMDDAWRRDVASSTWVPDRSVRPGSTRARWLAGDRLQVVAEGMKANPLPAASTPAEAPRALPESVAEQWLAALWRDLIGVARVGVDDNFFDLGGHSLLAMSLLARIEKQTGVRIALLKLANGTLRAVAAELPEASITAGPAKADGLGRRMLRLFGIERKGDDA